MTTEIRLKVRYAETDQMGIVHHAVYPIWFEVGRTDLLNQAGMSYGEIEERGFLLPLAELSCRYRSPARYEDEVIVKTRIAKMTNVKVYFHYEVVNARDGRLLTTGETLHAWASKALKPINLSKAAPALFQRLEELVE